MGEDGWGNIVDLLQQHNKRKRKGIASINGHPLPTWMQQCVYSDAYEGAEYLEANTPYFTAPQKRKAVSLKEKDERIESVGPKSDNTSLDTHEPTTTDLEPLDVELLAVLKKSLEDLQNTPPPHVLPPQFSYIRETQMLSEALVELSLFTLSDEALSEISRHFISIENSSYVQCLSFAKHALLPKVLGLTTTASRALVGGLIHCAKSHPAPIMQALLIPLVTEDTGPVQSEVVNRIAFAEKCLSPELCQDFMREIISKKQTWTDPFVVLLTNALSLSIQFNEEVISLLINQAGKQVDHFTTNLKFAKLILTLITKYSALAKPYTGTLQQTLSKCKNFMAKSALTQLEKL